MADSGLDWPSTLPPRLHEPLSRAAAGLPANVGLMQILMQCPEPGEAERFTAIAISWLRDAGLLIAAQRLDKVLGVLRGNPQAFGVVRRILDGLDHQRPSEKEALAYWASAFDRAARRDPEASVALYALGNSELLDAATGEIVGGLQNWGVLAAHAECLDIGCGIGRLEVSLAAHVRHIVGIDIAPAMIEEARRRCAGLPNVSIRATSGRDLAGFPDASFDLVLSVDCFPYLVQAGADLPLTMILEAERVLRPGGRLVILNFSYRGDIELDRADLLGFAARAGMVVLRNGTSEFTVWDAAAFDLQKP